jgi:hypothetical protein
VPDPATFETTTPGAMRARGAVAEVSGRPLAAVRVGDGVAAVHPAWMTVDEARNLARLLVYAAGDG